MNVRELKQSSAKALAVPATARWLMRGVTARMVEGATVSETASEGFKAGAIRCNHSHNSYSLDTAYSRTPCELPSNAGESGIFGEDLFELETPTCSFLLRASSAAARLVE